MLVYY